MRILLSFLLTAVSYTLLGQITLNESSVPELQQSLTYTLFENFSDTISFKDDGENLSWVYDDVETIGPEEELYYDISNFALQDSFPSANMMVDLEGFRAAAIRDTSGIRLIGLDELEFGGGFLPAQVTRLENPYFIRKVPLNYGDRFEDEMSISFEFGSEFIPGLDSLELPIEGASLDSVRVVTSFFKSEEVTAYGSLELLGNEFDVLKITQIDSTNTSFEIGLNLFGTIVWIDTADLFGDMGGGDSGDGEMGGFGDFGGPSEPTTTYKFVTNDRKVSVIEFVEITEVDTLGVATTTVNGRIGRGFEMISSTADLIDKSEEVVLAPNPAYDFIEIQSALPLNDFSGSIFGLDGKKMIAINNLSHKRRIDVSDLRVGIYFLRISDEEQIVLKKFVKQ